MKGVEELMSEEERAEFFGTPENLSRTIRLNAEYLAENGDEIARAYARFLTQ